MTAETLESFGIHWFRRDLRIAGNPGLKFNWQKTKGKTLGLFCFDANFLARPDFSTHRFQFFLATLQSLKEELQQSGGDLLVLNQPPEQCFKLLLDHFDKLKLSPPSLVTWNRDYEPFARQRDPKIKALLEAKGIESQSFRDHLIIEPHELVKNGTENEGYQVYSPFARKWMDQIQNNADIKSRLDKSKLGFDYLEKLKAGHKEKIFTLTWENLLVSGQLASGQNKGETALESSKVKNNKLTAQLEDHLARFTSENAKKCTIAIPKAGTLEAFKNLDNFKTKVKNYGKDRDFPDIRGTSRMSMFLKNGSITTAQIIAYLNLKPYSPKAISGGEKFYSEIVWREFYYHILFRKPEVEHQAFIAKYQDLKWHNNLSWFEAWKEGQTGFPIVDAGMRELKSTGWMHNRVRMIVASFLTKDLLIDWKWGEKYFMETLLDGDLAPNNGGWQWAASTGCDPQPYFRIFNPWSQSEKFDPKAEYIKTYIPELRDCDPKDIHKEGALRPIEYPRPIVDHAVQRQLALSLYKEA